MRAGGVVSWEWEWEWEWLAYGAEARVAERWPVSREQGGHVTEAVARRTPGVTARDAIIEDSRPAVAMVVQSEE